MVILRDQSLAAFSFGERRLHILALSGGGIRGIFSARILELIEEETRVPCHKLFDLIAGTSIGGIIAIGLAKGVPARRIRLAIEKFGPHIFKSRYPGAGWFGARYGTELLCRAVRAILGNAAAEKIGSIEVPLIVTTVDQTTAAPRLIVSNAPAYGKGDFFTLLDAALATSAAPTYFPAHLVGGHSFIDGGVIANAPDVIAITEAIRTVGVDIGEVYLLGVGTAGLRQWGRIEGIGAPGRFGWLIRHKLFDLTIGAQEALAQDQVNILLGRRALRIDAQPQELIPFDRADSSTIRRLLFLAEEAYQSVKKHDSQRLNEFLAYRTKRTKHSI